MSKAIEAKEVLVNELAEKIERAQSLVLYDYRGLTVEEVTGLRNQFREAGVEYRVIKNSIIERAAAKRGIEGLDNIVGPTAIAFGYDDPVAPAKILTDFIAKLKKTELKSGVIEGKTIDPTGVKALAALPGREQLIAKLLGTLNAPVTGLVSVLGGNLRGVVRAVDALREKKEAAGE